jgi:uncharacterized OB-fold protein
MTTLERPLPIVNEANALYWQSARAHQLRLPKCGACDRFFYPLTPRCRHCLAADAVWTTVSGDATLVTWNVMHQVYDKAFEELAPYPVAVVRLAEGPQVVTNIVGADPAALQAGMPLRLDYLDINDEITLPVYAPASR